MGLLNLAQQGRNGDTRIAHMTPGEVVIPKEVAKLRPDIVKALSSQIAQMGGDPRRLQVGQGHVNPQTGVEEFATEAEVAAAYESTLGRAPDAAGLSYWMGQSDLSGFASDAATEIASNVSAGYQDNFGREGETAGIDYWTNKANSGEFKSVNDLYGAMRAGAQNDDILAQKDGAQYSTAWRADINPNKDALRYDAALDKWNPIKQPMATAGQYSPNFNSGVDAGMETIEGRIKNLLDQNNPVIQQAGNRAMAQFAQRGLLNSSMAIEAANEAMTSKAIEIAGPDAQKYFTNRRENIDWTNKFAQAEQQQGYDIEKLNTSAALNKDLNSSNSALSQTNALQTNYLQSVSNAEGQMKQFIQSIQMADMPEAAKTAQIAEAQTMFNNTISMMKAAYASMPQWSSEWAMLPATIG